MFLAKQTAEGSMDSRDLLDKPTAYTHPDEEIYRRIDWRWHRRALWGATVLVLIAYVYTFVLPQ